MDCLVFLGLRRPVPEMYRTVLAAERLNLSILAITESVPVLPAERFADVFLCSYRNTECILDKIGEWSRKYTIKGIVNWHDVTTPLRAMACERLGLPGMSISASMLSRNKYLMKETLSDISHVLPRYALVESLEHLRRAVKEIGLPTVVKPLSGTSSKGIYEIGSENELEPAYKALQSVISNDKDGLFAEDRGKILVEEMMIGQEVSLDGLIHEDRIMFWDIVNFRSTPKYHMDYYKIYPTNLPQKIKHEIYGTARDILGILGFRNTAFHLEGIVTPTGFKFYEVAARPGAGCIATHLIPDTAGCNYLAAYYRVAMGQRPDTVELMPETIGNYRGIIYSLANKEGVFAAMHGLPQVLSIPGVEHIYFDNPIGSVVSLPPKSSLASRGAYAIVSGSSYGEVEATMDVVSRSLTMEVL